MIRLNKDIGYILALLRGLKYLHDKNKSIVENLNQEFPSSLESLLSNLAALNHTLKVN